MNNSKMLLLVVITMLNSISIIKTSMTNIIEDPKERKELIKQLARHSFKATVDKCEQYNDDPNTRDQNDICIENLDLFFRSIQNIPFNQLESLFNKCEKDITNKNQQIKCPNCKIFNMRFQELKSDCLAKSKEPINAGNGLLTLNEYKLKNFLTKNLLTKEQSILEEKEKSLAEIALERMALEKLHN